MPRKPGPMYDLIVEGLSTGELTRTIDKFNDWTGEPIPIAYAPKAGDLPMLAKARQERAKVAQAEQVQRTMVALNKALSTGMPTKFTQPEFKPFKRRV